MIDDVGAPFVLPVSNSTFFSRQPGVTGRKEGKGRGFVCGISFFLSFFHFFRWL